MSFSHTRIGPGDDSWRAPEAVPVAPGEWPELAAALAVVNRDLAATRAELDPLVLIRHPPWTSPHWGGESPEQIYVALSDGRAHGNAVNPRDPEPGDPQEPDHPAHVLAVVAEAAQDTVQELFWQVWPVCREHGLGVHVRPAGTGGAWPDRREITEPPVWWCRGNRPDGHHDVCPIGELADLLPGKQRRALRREQRRRDGHHKP